MARRVSNAVPCGVVQIIRLHWEKSARGGQGARDRSAVPQSLTIPAAELADIGGHLCIDASDWGERNDFAQPFSARRHRVAVAEGFKFGCVSVSAHPEGLQVRYQYDQANGGAPDRWFLNCPSEVGGSSGRVLLVRPETWARVCYNGRFAVMDSGNWWYEQTTVNVAWFAGEPDGRAFLDREPSQELQALADLW